MGHMLICDSRTSWSKDFSDSLTDEYTSLCIPARGQLQEQDKGGEQISGSRKASHTADMKLQLGKGSEIELSLMSKVTCNESIHS